MAVSAEYKNYLAEIFEPLGLVEVKRMFGGAGVWHRGVLFALYARDALYFKVDDENRPDFQDAGMGPFTYDRKTGERQVESLYELPEALLDDPDELLIWAGKAVEAAFRADARKPPSKRRAQ